MTDERPQEVEAEVIEPPAELTDADRWLAATRERVAELLPRYGTHDITCDADYKDIKQARAMLRKDIAEIDAERKARTRAVEDAVARFRNGCAAALAPLAEVERDYKAQLDEWERGWTERRMAMLRAVYEETAPLLAPVVPLERLCERFAKQDKWLLRGTGYVKARELLLKRVETVAKEWCSLDSLDMTDDERAMAKAEYTRTLDLGAAAQKVVDERERREQIAAIDAYNAPEQEPEPAPEPRESPAVEAARRAYEAARANPAPEPAPTAPEPMERHVFEFECTRSQLTALMAFLKSSGIHGKRRKVS